MPKNPPFLLMASFLPHVGGPTGPDIHGATTRQEAWKWMYFQVRDHFQRPQLDACRAY